MAALSLFANWRHGDTRRGTVRPAVSASNGSEAELSEPGDDRALGSLKSTGRLFVQM